ncbi:Uncharacterised protein [Yersinia similis]|uniref:hypothetical protein n=1 Tax=Yersinia similis TaxID=367190 RepID=UPI0005E68B81|nr:hypothetical protein [Yersinia similis]CNE41131.1 Uncharacterised protein [Yersinia similis]
MNNIEERIESLKANVALSELIGPDELTVTVSVLSALIAQLEAAQKRIAELDNSESQLINERDHAESTINSMFVAVMSEKPEWSNMYQFIDAVDEVEYFVSILKQRAESAEAALSAANERLSKPVYMTNYSVTQVMEMSGHPTYPDYIAPRDAYPKKTCLWTGGGFVMPDKLPVSVPDGYSTQYLKLGGKSERVKNMRSATPRGFAEAVFQANAPHLKALREAA